MLNMRSKTPNSKLMKKTSVGDALFPKVKRQLLAHFFLTTGKKHYFREITRLIKASPGAVQRELKSLTEAGIVASEKIGRQRYYWADPECMIYSELKGMVIKTFGVVDAAATALNSFDKDVTVAFIYGSVASGSDSARSDIDLLVIGSLTFRELVSALKPVEEIMQRPINPNLYSVGEIQKKVRSENSFLKNVMNSEKLFVVGGQDDLDRLVK